jgi:hypothetical protein
MPATRDKSPDEVIYYIDGLPQWSKKLCLRLREIILKADDSLTESWKWGPHYASNGMVCGFGAFQKHVKFTIFNGSAMKDDKGVFNHCTDNEFSRSIKYVSEDELDEKMLTAYIRESVRLNHTGFKRVTASKHVEVPSDLEASLARDAKAQAFFNGLSYVYKKDFVEYITSAKREQTRIDRIAKVVAHASDGRKLNDKYQ